MKKKHQLYNAGAEYNEKYEVGRSLPDLERGSTKSSIPKDGDH